jgi:hypothetical protein
MNKLGLHQTEHFLHSKRKKQSFKIQPTEWENIIASYLANKVLISRICRGLRKLSPQRINISVKKWAHELNREFSKEEEQMVSKYMKKYSASLVKKEVQIKTTLQFHLTPVRMAIFKGNNNNKCLGGCSETGTLI